MNLGIGIPTRVVDWVPAEREVVFHSENGLLGVGPRPGPEADPDLINAGKDPVTVVPAAVSCPTPILFGAHRGGHLDLTVMGGFEVSARGDLANWAAAGEMVPAVGGAMDLAAGAKNVWVAMTHTTAAGEPSLSPECRLPLTGRGVVSRVYTDLAVLEVDRHQGCFVVLDTVPGLDLDAVQEVTAAPLRQA